MNKRILILSEEWAGGGHWMAAVALQQALEECSPASRVDIIGGLGRISPLLREISRFSYENSIRYFPWVWQQLYDQQKMWSKSLNKPLAKLLGKRMLHQVIEQEEPDAVVATHAYCLSALTEAKRLARKPFRLVVVFTDFHINPFWLHEQVDAYVVAHEQIGNQLVDGHGVDPAKVYAYGIPLRPPFAKEAKREKKEWRSKLGLEQGLFTVLISGGAGGWGGISEVAKRLLQQESRLQLVIATGRNNRLQQQLMDELPSCDGRHTVRLLGYIESIWEWIGAADVTITKAGGLTCSEALAMKTPMILYRPLPGQERYNSRFLQEQKLAIEAGSIEEVANLVANWQADQERPIERNRKDSDTLIPADSAYRTADLLLQL